MPALLPAPGVARVAIHQRLDNTVDMVNVFHVAALADSTPGYSSDELAAIATAVGNAWGAYLMPQLSSDMRLNLVVVQDISSDTGFAASHVFDIAGSQAANALPANCAVVLSWPEALRYRGGHARTYIGGVAQDFQISPKTIAPAMVTGLANGGATFRTAVNAITTGGISGLSLGVLHRKKNKVDRNPPVFGAVGPPHVDSRIDSQRRRLGKP